MQKASGPAPMTSAQAEAYIVLASIAADEKIALAKKGLLEHPELASRIKQTSVPRDSWQTAGGQFTIASALIHSWIYSNPTLDFPDGKKLAFNADVWGFGIGAGVIWLVGCCMPPEELVGETTFALQTNPLVTEIAFFKNGNPAGVLIGGGLNTQVGYFGGTGVFALA